MRNGINNKALFITALGVYFGLMLSGAAPNALARQAAMARNFDVSDEIEVNDDLDTTPDGDRSPVSASVQIYLEDVEYFLTSLGLLRSKGTFDLAKDTFDVAQSTLLPCVDNNRAGRYTPIRFDSSTESSRKALDYFSRNLAYGYSLGDCIVNNEFKGVAAVDSRFNFQLDGQDFHVELSVKKRSNQNAAALVTELTAMFRKFAEDKAAVVRQKIIENTAVRSKNDQVFVVTRLPRAGLDSLFAAKDAR